MASIIEQLWFIKKKRLQREEERHQHWLQEQERERQRQVAGVERQKKRQLLKDSLNWKRARRIRQYVKAAEGEKQADLEEFVKWKEWALAYADELDPLVSG